MYLLVEIGNHLCVITRHDRRVEPGIIFCGNEALGRDFAGSADLEGVLRSGQSQGPCVEVLDVGIRNDLDGDCIEMLACLGHVVL
jgi:hypothetical protein